MLAGALTILAKDLRLRLRDRSVVMFALVVPLGLSLLLAGILPETEDLTLTAGVVDEDGSPAAASFAEEVLPELQRQGLVDLVDLDGREAAREAMASGDLDAAWILPAGFGQAVTAGQGASLEVLVNPDRGLRAQVARAIADRYGAELDRISLAVTTAATAAGGLDEAGAQALAAEVAASEPALRLVDEPAQDRQLDLPSHVSAGMAAFFVFFTVQFGVLGLLEERQAGTLRRLLAAPLPVASIHVGKALSALVLGLVSMTVLALAAPVALGARWGPPGAVAALIVGIVLAALGLMALVGSFARTAEQAGNHQAIVAVVLGMVSGAFFPLPLDEGLLRVISWVSPHAWFLRGLQDASGAEAWTAALPSAAALVGFAVLTAVLASLRIRRSVGT